MIAVPKEQKLHNGVLVYGVPYCSGVLHGADCDCLHWSGGRRLQTTGTQNSMLSLQVAWR